MAETLLTVEHLIKKYGDQVILDDVSLDVKKGEVIVQGRRQPVVCQIEWYLHACFMMQVNAICPMFQHHLRMNYRNIRSRKNICLA